VRWPVRGRITKQPTADIVTVEVRTSGRLFRWFLGVSGAVTQALFLGVVLFGLAGTTDWPRAWIFIAVWAVNILVVCVVAGTDVIIERLWPIRDLRRMDRADLTLLLVMGPIVAAWLVLIPLDRFHLELLPLPSLGISVTGLVLVIAGWVFMTLSVRQNRFASPVVKLQEQQVVVDHGVYSIVRHPMYLGGSLFVIGLPLWLESYAAAMVSLLLVGALAIRIRIEERVLNGLAGYPAYTQRVRHRLIPFLW